MTTHFISGKCLLELNWRYLQIFTLVTRSITLRPTPIKLCYKYTCRSPTVPGCINHRSHPDNEQLCLFFLLFKASLSFLTVTTYSALFVIVLSHNITITARQQPQDCSTKPQLRMSSGAGDSVTIWQWETLSPSLDNSFKNHAVSLLALTCSSTHYGGMVPASWTTCSVRT